MSAFVVSKKHIDRLVATIIQGPANYRTPGYGGWSLPRYAPDSMHATSERTQADQIGQIFINEMLNSIHARYPDTIAKPENTPGPCERYWEDADGYRYVPQHGDRLPVVQALKALACYEYQSCEHDGWADSQVRHFCERFRHSLINALPGYEDAEWELT